jgi:hypothetical protein
MTRKLALKLAAAVLAIWLLAAYGIDAGGSAAHETEPSPQPAAATSRPIATKSTPKWSAPARVDHPTTVAAVGPPPSVGAVQPPAPTSADAIDPRQEPTPIPVSNGPSALEVAFNEESRDETHTAEMRSYLEESARASDLDPSIVKETDCGVNVCRAVLAFAHGSDAYTFASSAQNSGFRYEVRVPMVPPALSPADAPAPSPAAAAQLPPDPAPSTDTESGPMKVEILLARRDFGAEDEPQPAAR